MKTYEATGKNYEEALQNGLTALHATISDVTVETLEEGLEDALTFLAFPKLDPGFPLRYHYDSGLTPNAENQDACFTVTSLYIGAFPG